MNKQAVRITQFVINSILTFVSFTSAILVFLLLVPLAITALISFFVHNWSFFWNFLVIVAILLGVAFFIETLSFKLPEMFGKFFEEEKEDEKIYQEYENWFNEWYQKEYEKYQQKWQEQQNQQGYSTHYSAEDIIDSSGELTLQTIKKAHRTKAKEFHPDKNPGKDTTADMQRVNAAKEYLDANLEYYLSKISKN